MKYFSLVVAQLILFYFASQAIAQGVLHPNLAINPSLGWSWSRAELFGIDENKTKLFLHFKTQKKTAQPSVLIGHDNAGISENEITYAEFLYSRGFNVFITDRITSRKRAARPLEKFLISDTFASIEYIKTKFSPQIDSSRLSYVSFSGDGGFGGLMAIEPKARSIFNSAMPDNFKLRKVVAFYPHCLHMKGRNTDTPTLIIAAELDGSDPVVCQKAYSNFPIVRVEILKGAYHGFDQSGLKSKTWISKPVTMPGKCEWTIDLDIPREQQGLHYFMLFTPSGISQNSPEFSAYNRTCTEAVSGYFSEYREDITRATFQMSVEFLEN